MPFALADDEPPVGRDPRAGEVELGRGQQHPPLAAGHVDHDQFAMRLARGVPLPPSGDDRGAVRGQLERFPVERPSRLGREVTQPGWFRRPFGPFMPLTFSTLCSTHFRHPKLFVPPSPSDVSFLHLVGVDGEQPGLVRPQVVVPVPDRRRLVQDGADPGVLALLAQPRVVLGGAARGGRPRGTSRCVWFHGGATPGPPWEEPILPDLLARGGQHRRADHDPAGVRGHLGGRDAAGQGRHDPGLTAGRGEQPQRGDITGVGVRSGVLPARIGISGPPGGEQQRPVGQETRAALALGGAGQPPARAAVGVDSPDAGQVLLLVGAQRLDGRRQPGPVRCQPQRRHPRYRHEVPQVMERGSTSAHISSRSEGR